MIKKNNRRAWLSISLLIFSFIFLITISIVGLYISRKFFDEYYIVAKSVPEIPQATKWLVNKKACWMECWVDIHFSTTLSPDEVSTIYLQILEDNGWELIKRYDDVSTERYETRGSETDYFPIVPEKTMSFELLKTSHKNIVKPFTLYFSLTYKDLGNRKYELLETHMEIRPTNSAYE